MASFLDKVFLALGIKREDVTVIQVETTDKPVLTAEQATMGVKVLEDIDDGLFDRGRAAEAVEMIEAVKNTPPEQEPKMKYMTSPEVPEGCVRIAGFDIPSGDSETIKKAFKFQQGDDAALAVTFAAMHPEALATHLDPEVTAREMFDLPEDVKHHVVTRRDAALYPGLVEGMIMKRSDFGWTAVSSGSVQDVFPPEHARDFEGDQLNTGLPLGIEFRDPAIVGAELTEPMRRQYGDLIRRRKEFLVSGLLGFEHRMTAHQPPSVLEWGLMRALPPRPVSAATTSRALTITNEDFIYEDSSLDREAVQALIEGLREVDNRGAFNIRYSMSAKNESGNYVLGEDNKRSPRSIDDLVKNELTVCVTGLFGVLPYFRKRGFVWESGALMKHGEWNGVQKYAAEELGIPKLLTGALVFNVPIGSSNLDHALYLKPWTDVTASDVICVLEDILRLGASQVLKNMITVYEGAKNA